MSSNFTGVTFAEQRVTPADDALIHRAALPDGILSGCELSYSGSTLTMGAGSLLACGRQFRHPSTQNWAVIDATTGFARLLLTIDLSRTATESVFDQIVDTIEYASAADGFPDLVCSDVNEGGTKYQIVVCVVSLGTGGITGIVSQLGFASLANDFACRLMMRKVWENDSPTKVFAAKNVLMDMHGGQWLAIEYLFSTDSTRRKTAFGRIGTQITMDIISKSYFLGTRMAFPLEGAEYDGISFGDAAYSAEGAVQNEYVIPLAVYVISGVIE